MRDFDFLEPASVAEASRMLADLGEDCRVMAGGTALMLAMRQRMLVPSHIISVARIEALRGIRFDPVEGLRIGALARHTDVADSAVVKQHYPMLAAMAAQVANPQVRNQGTLGGNLCYADPSTDPPTCLMSLGARVVLGSARRAGAVHRGVPGGLLRHRHRIRRDRRRDPRAGAAGGFLRPVHPLPAHRRRAPAADRPVAGHAPQRRHLPRGGPGGGRVHAHSCRVPRAEHFLAGKTITPEVAAEAASIVAADIQPVSDARGSDEFRREMVRVVTRRTIAGLYGLATD